MKDSYIAKYNDIRILGIVNSFRFLPLQVLTKILIEKKLYGSYQAVSRCVNRLREHGLIRTTYYTNNAKIIFLSRLGAKQLATGTGVNEDSINCPERLTGVNFFALEHTVKVANLYLLIQSECQRLNIELLEFKGDHSIRYEYEYRAETGRMIKRLVMPDAIIKLQRESKPQLTIFIEYDRGTESSNDVALKYTKYFEYFMFGDWKTTFDTEDFPIIIFVSENTEQRILNLIPKEQIQNLNDYYTKWDSKSYRNVVLRGISLHDNIHTCLNDNIAEFLYKNHFLFVTYDNLKKNGLQTKMLNFMQDDSFISN
jgi:hypothetical protein